MRLKLLSAISTFGAIILGFRLGVPELLQWDEALYSTRALAILKNGNWLDQTSDAVGGLWTSAHPPLAIWSMALSGWVFGANEWSMRLPAALSGIGCLVIVYLFGQKLSGKPLVGLLAVVCLLLQFNFVKYSRMSQLDIPVLFWILLCLYLFFLGTLGHSRWWFVTSGIAFGLGLMTKILVAALVPMGLALYVVLGFQMESERAEVWRKFAGLMIVIFTGLLVAAPWHIAISIIHGESYWQKAIGYHVIDRMSQPLEGHGSSLGILYWPHEILLSFGALLPWLFIGIQQTHRRNGLSKQNGVLLACILIVPLAVCTVTATKFLPYLLLFIVPLVLYTAVGAEAFINRRCSSRTEAVVLPLAIATCSWAITPKFHQAITRFFSALMEMKRPYGSDALLILIYTMVVLIMIPCLRFLYLRFKDNGRHQVRISTGIVAVVISAAFSFTPMGFQSSPWSETQASIHPLLPCSLLFVGDNSAVNRFYLTTISPTNPVAWRIISIDKYPGLIIDSDIIVIEKNHREITPKPGYTKFSESAMHVVWLRAGPWQHEPI